MRNHDELSRLVQEGDFHRAVLGDYRDVYTLGIGRHPSRPGSAIVVLSTTESAPARLVQVPYGAGTVEVLREGGLSGPGWPL